jgi:hypothetical protein
LRVHDLGSSRNSGTFDGKSEINLARHKPLCIIAQ